MTKEGIIKKLKNSKGEIRLTSSEAAKIVDYLEKDSYKDAISRHEVISLANNSMLNLELTGETQDFCMEVYNLPSFDPDKEYEVDPIEKWLAVYSDDKEINSEEWCDGCEERNCDGCDFASEMFLRKAETKMAIVSNIEYLTNLLEKEIKRMEKYKQ